MKSDPRAQLLEVVSMSAGEVEEAIADLSQARFTLCSSRLLAPEGAPEGRLQRGRCHLHKGFTAVSVVEVLRGFRGGFAGVSRGFRCSTS